MCLMVWGEITVGDQNPMVGADRGSSSVVTVSSPLPCRDRLDLIRYM